MPISKCPMCISFQVKHSKFFGHDMFFKNNLIIVKSILRIIIPVHVLKLVQINFECFTPKPNVHGTF